VVDRIGPAGEAGDANLVEHRFAAPLVVSQPGP
jgi:hypothetical protein